MKKISVELLKQVLSEAYSKDLDDEIVIDEMNEEYKCVTLFLNDNAWRKLEEALGGKK